jgi:hypothetical protein
MARPGGPLELPSSDQWEVALVGLLLAEAASHDAVGRAETHVDRWFAAHRTNDLDRATHHATDAAETPTIAVLAVLTVAGAALAWRRWREPMLVGKNPEKPALRWPLPRHG